ncbi:hypothetical protein KAW96_02700 [candidate division WOR-3 bacterium]|nr:hypothetical protein [candidate division WOR-3 bacterium]
MNFKPIGVSIQWISKEESRRQFFSDNKLIIRMRKHQNQNKNFVYASMVFVSKALLRKTKRYISLSQKESIDLFIAKKLFEKGKSTILDQFFDDYFFPRINSGKKLAELIEKYNLMDKAGLFFPVFIQELTFLGEKVFFQRKSSEIIKEVNQFINFLENYANREIGEKDVSNTFEGTYCRCGIMIIAKWFKIGDVSPFIKYIKSLIAKKMEDIYVIGPDYKFNADFMNQISEFAQNNLKLEKYCEKKYKAKIKIEGERKEFNNYLILLRSPETIRYYDSEYKKQFMD